MVVGVEGWDGSSEGFDVVCTACTNRNDEDLIIIQVNDIIEAAFESYEVGSGESAEEDGILPAVAEVLAGTSDFAESLGVSDIVGNQVGMHRRSSRDGVWGLGVSQEEWVAGCGFGVEWRCVVHRTVKPTFVLWGSLSFPIGRGGVLFIGR
jgi:hypothetical protein